MRRGVLAGTVMFALAAGAAGPVRAQQVCAKADFEAVVDEAAAALRDLNAHNRPAFQDKLRLLREKRGWSQDQFLRQAEPFVRDDQIVEFDNRSQEFLARINSLGEEGAGAKAPDCKLLAEVRAAMKGLVDTQTEKWGYMFAKLDRALGS
jgi:hypothetical protein